MSIPIVVVDDDEVDRYLVKRVVGALGIDANLIEYDMGERFVQALEAQEIGQLPPPLLVFLDIRMPRMSGFEVLEALHGQLKDDQVMIVTMYSSSNHAEDRADAMKYSFVKDYIVKPLTKDKLRELLAAHYPSEVTP